MSRLTVGCWTAMLAVLSASASAVISTESNQAWQEPVDTELPAASVSFELPPDEAPEAWAASHGITDYQVFPLGQAGVLVEAALPAGAGVAERDALCASPGVSNCEPVRCREIQLETRWIGTQAAGSVLSARLLRQTPSLAQVLEGAAGAPGRCDASDPYAEGARTLGETPAGAQLGDADLPADTECWTLAMEASCGVVNTPLSSVAPSVEPMRVLAVLDASNAPQAAAIAASYGLAVLRVLPLRATQETLALLSLDGQQDAQSALTALQADPRVSAAQSDFRYQTSTKYSDPLAALTYGPEKTGAVRLHASTTGKGTLVAVIDTGADLEHAELAGRIEGHVDLTGSGFTADLHGTAIAGIVAARPGNSVGSYGVAPDAKLLLLKACEALEAGKLASRCWTSTLVAALDEAFARDARVINLSLGGPPDPLLARYVAIAHEQGRILVAAAGNGGPAAKPTFPAALPNVVAVTATDASDAGYREANQGSYIAVSAPGVDIVSAAPDGTYPALSGTSMASAHVAGVIALLLQAAPNATADEVAAALVDTAVDLGASGRDPRFGAGRLDACMAASRLSAGSVLCEE